MEVKTFKYRNREEYAYKVLKQRVNQYFTERGISRFANKQVIVKSIIIALTMIISYSLIMSDLFNPLVMLLFSIVFGFASLMLGFNIGHDAAHNAFSHNTKLNKLLAGTLCAVGSSAYVWKIRHNLNHHANSNIPEYDWTAYAHKRILTGDSNKLIAILSRYPHIYTPVLYSLYFIFLTFYKDFEIFYSNRIGNAYHFKPNIKEHIIFLSSKLIYITMILVLPMIYLSLVWWQVVIGYLIMHMVAGFIFALVAIPPHLTEDAVFPTVNDEGYLSHSRFTHNLDTTTDFARKSVVINWIFGGFNTHVIHHLFPNICHAHYIPLSQILKDTMDEFGFKYKETTLWGAVLSHYNFLKNMGKGKQVEKN
ncbi:MAG: fatty acid desaturase [Chitinophagaceae bacterium]